MPQRFPPEIRQLSECIGDFIQHWGFKKIHGQIWALIFLAKDPMDATSIVKKLGVSKALVSLAIKDLLFYEVIQIVGHGQRRKILFRSNPNLMSVVARVLNDREKKMIDRIDQAHQQISAVKSDPKFNWDLHEEKFAELGKMIETAHRTLGNLMKSGVMNQR